MNFFERRVTVFLGAVALSASVGASLSFDDVRPPSGAPATGRTARPPAEQRVTDDVRPRVVDPLATYSAMRDDANPKPRLQLIDAWARTAAPDAASDLIGMALVDPDESVRARAQELFERRIQLH